MNDRNLELKKIRDLDISAAATGGRPLHLSAGSGLVRHGRAIYVIADDELHLGRFSVDGVEPGRLVRLFDGVLPDAKGARKRLKPDVEALVLMPALTGFPNGSLLAIGSGSNANRHRGALLGFDPYGDISGPPRTVDLSEFLHPLEQHFSEINIEGAVVIGDEFHFFQRGNGKQAENAIIRYPLQPFLETLEGGSAVQVQPLSVDRVDLGSVHGVPFGFTDAAALSNGEVVFCAVAEDTRNTFLDGECIAAAIGILGKEGHLRFWQHLDQPRKIEGIDARYKDQRLDLLLVTDPDDANVAATLLACTIDTSAWGGL